MVNTRNLKAYLSGGPSEGAVPRMIGLPKLRKPNEHGFNLHMEWSGDIIDMAKQKAEGLDEDFNDVELEGAIDNFISDGSKSNLGKTNKIGYEKIVKLVEEIRNCGGKGADSLVTELKRISHSSIR